MFAKNKTAVVVLEKNKQKDMSLQHESCTDPARVGVFLHKEISGVKTIYPCDQHST